MKPVQPFTTRDELQQAVDNGGRFYHLFSHAGDQVISKGELAKAAGVVCNLQNGILFLELAWRDLPSRDQEQIVDMLVPSLRDRLDELRPLELLPSEVEHRGEAGAAVVVAGWPTFAREKMSTTMIPIMVGQVVTMVPMEQKFHVYEVFNDEERTGTSTLATMPVDTDLLEETPTRFAGYLRELKTEDGDDKSDATQRFYLETVFYTDLPT